MTPTSLPPLPVFGWASFSGGRAADTPCLLDHPTLCFTTSGRASLLLAMETLGVEAGCRVLVPTYHCPSVVAPVTERGGEPVFYPVTGNGEPDMRWLEAADTTGVRAIVVAHYFGLLQPLRAIREWCDRRGIALVEDCAHALFGRSDGRPVGAWGDCAIGSLPKFLPVLDGGCLVFNGTARASTLKACPPVEHLKGGLNIVESGARRQRLTGLNLLISGLLDGVQRLRGGRVAGHADETPLLTPLPPELDGDFRVDAVLAHREPNAPTRWIARRLPRARIVARRRAFYETLSARLSGIPGLRPLRPELPPDCAPYVFPLWVDQPLPAYTELRRRRIPVFRWDRVWPGTPTIEGDHGLAWAHHVFQLACHQDLDDAEIERYVCDVLDVLAPNGVPASRVSTRPA